MMSLSRPLATLLAGVTATALVSAGPAFSATPLDPGPRHDGASWLSGELTHGLVHNEQYDFDDYGLSIDVALGLDAAGQKSKVVDAIVKAVAKNIDAYTTAGFNVYAGATAKALLLAVEQGRNPRQFGGTDLVNRLESRVATAAPITGRIEDAFDPNDPYGADYANVIGQAFAAPGLRLAKSPKAASVLAFLLQQQCSQGYFRLSFTQDKAAPDQSCDGAPKAQRRPDTDATAFALLALTEVKPTPATKAAAKKALAWLKDQQHADGSFGGGKATEAPNANSTGLAGWALAAWGQRKPATSAATWLRRLQVPRANPCSAKLAGEAGAVAYDVTAFESGRDKGITTKTSDQWRRSTAQALPVLRLTPAGDGALTATGPGHVVAGGERFTIALTGVAPGQRVCVSGAGTSSEYVPGRNALTKVTVVAPHGTATRTYTVYVGNKQRTVTVHVKG
jgi:hypothetical protein